MKKRNNKLLKNIKKYHSFQKYVFQSVSIYLNVSKNVIMLLMRSSIHFVWSVSEINFV